MTIEHDKAARRMRAYLQQVATGPELSKSLSRVHAKDAMKMLVRQQVDAVQAGIYLIALRMKRETDDENLGALDALLELRAQHTVDCDQLIDIADPFNGYVRSLPATPFLGAVLAACGLKAYSHGLRVVGPKYGVTHHLVYAAAGIPVDLSLSEAAKRIADAHIGWAYVDQACYFPALHDLVKLRAQMVKRACITTLEVLLGPLRARETHLMTGYVHKDYPPVYCMLARAAGYHDAMIVRGVEGGCIPSLSQPAKFFRYGNDDANGATREVKIAPQSISIEQSARAIPIPSSMLRETSVALFAPAECGLTDEVAVVDVLAAAAQCAELGLQALGGEAGAMRDSLIYASAICLFHSGRAANLQDGATQSRAVLDSGAALAHFVAARQ